MTSLLRRHTNTVLKLSPILPLRLLFLPIHVQKTSENSENIRYSPYLVPYALEPDMLDHNLLDSIRLQPHFGAQTDGS